MGGTIISLPVFFGNLGDGYSSAMSYSRSWFTAARVVVMLEQTFFRHDSFRFWTAFMIETGIES